MKMTKETNYKQYQILDFDPDICGVEDGYIVLFSPYKLIVDGVLVIPDGKTITGKNSVGTRLVESIGQSNRVLLNMPSGYNTRLLAADIKTYFELNEAALEVLIFKGKSELSIYRRFVSNSRFYSEFKKTYEQ